jgi:Tol biopolymer transport system component
MLKFGRFPAGRARMFAKTIFIVLMFSVAGITKAQVITKPRATPTVFAPNEISTGGYQVAQEFTPDGETIYFVESTPDGNFWTLVFSHLSNGHWNTPQVAPFSGQYSDADPFITADGNRFFFISRRPLSPASKEPRNLDIWVMSKTATGWSEPHNLGRPVNSDESEYFPTLTSDGTLYFGSRRKGGKGGVDLYRSRLVNGKYTEPENLGDQINTQFDEYEPFIAPDESFLIFMAAGRPEGLGGFDLFVSYRRNGQWTKAKNLGAPINSAADELSPKVSRDGKYFFWTSTRSDFNLSPLQPRTSSEFYSKLQKSGNGVGDIYYIDFGRLNLEH